MTSSQDGIDLIVIPFHDQSKGLREGVRTRDGHLLEHLIHASGTRRALVIDRPSSLLEAIVFPKPAAGEVCFRLGRCKEIRQDKKVSLLRRHVPWDVFPRIAAGVEWYVSAYGKPDLHASILCWLKREDRAPVAVLSFNLFAADLCERLSASGIPVVFDAFDDLRRFRRPPARAGTLDRLYRSYAKISPRWITNSDTNRNAFALRYGVASCEVVRNGVDSARFREQRPVPADLRDIPRPWVGFGGKLSHLLDRRLLVDVANLLPDVSIVVVGQRLRGEPVLPRGKHGNIWYLGDKHYDEYPSYVCNWDICIMPYVCGDLGHGGDAIKLYEYLAAGKCIVSTPGNGTEGREGRIAIASSAKEFADAIRHALVGQPDTQRCSDRNYEWTTRAETVFRVLEEAASWTGKAEDERLDVYAYHGPGGRE